MIASGTFDVQIKPLDTYNKGTEGILLGRMSIDKTFHGALSATSKGEMLSVQSSVKGAGGYVAIEQITGELDEKRGSFIVQHYGMMDKDASQSLTIEVVPQSATEELKGLAGKLTIRVEDGKHYYDLDYHL